MSIFADVDTALSEVPVNSVPLTDDTDFKTTEESIAYNASGMDLEWHFFTTAGAYTVTAVTPTTGGDYDWAHQGNGMYTIEIPASGGASINNDTEGHGYFVGMVTGVLPFRGPTIIFRAAALNDALIDGGDRLDVNVAEISDDTAAATNAEAFFDGTGYAGTNNVIPTVTTTTNLTNAPTSGDLTATMKASVNAEVDTALTDIGLDHLLAASVTGTDVTDDSIIAKLVSKSATADWDNFVNTTDSLQAIRDQGDSAWITATGFSTFNAGSDTVTTGAVSTGAITAAAIADGAIDAATFAADVDAEILSYIVDDATRIDASALNAITADLTDGGRLDLLLDATSTHSATDVWAAGTRTLTAATNITSDGAAINATAGVVDNVTTVATTTTNTDMRGTDSAFLAANAPGDTYWADVQFTRDQTNTRDEWTVTWYKNGTRQTSGITSPTIQIVKRADGTDLVASSAMTQIGSTGSYKYDEDTNRVTVGEAVLVVVGATIDASGRSFSRLVGRDSS